jgi:RNA polymerase sigma-70 factor (ECF subfamily)
METEQWYKELRPLLFSLAYQMMGSIMDAEDLVQEAFVSLQEVPSGHIRNVKAYLCKMVTNRCVNKLKSASRQRETYVGPWLPEPYVKGEGQDPLDDYISKESLTTAYLLLLQQLSVNERVVFLLREIFQYSFQEIADMTGKSAGNCRQIYYRAKRSIGDVRDEQKEIHFDSVPAAETFAQAVVSGNFAKLMELLSSETTLFTDGGGKFKTAIRPISGSALIIRFFEAVRPMIPPEAHCEIHEINGQPGVIIKTGRKVFSAISFQLTRESISKIYILLNPDKLQHMNQMS